MAAILQIYVIIFLYEKGCILNQISYKCVPKGPIDNYSALIQVMSSTEQTETFTRAIHEYIYVFLGRTVIDDMMLLWCSNHCLSGKLWYLQHICVEDTIIYQWDREMGLWFIKTGWSICVSKLTIIGSDNGLLPGQHQAII